MTLTKNIVEGYTEIFDFQKRCCYYLIIQKNKKANHNLYECISYRENIKCKIYKRIGIL